MKVLLYSENLKQIEKSGLGKAIKHQQIALEKAGIDYTLDPNDDFDLLHINTYFFHSKILAKKCQQKAIPVVYHAHSTMEDFKNSFMFSNQLAPLFKSWIISCYKYGNVLITPTPYSKQLLSSYPINRPIVSLSNGIDLEKFAPQPYARQTFRKRYDLAEDQFTVIGIGLYIERKGILDFIELANRLPHIRFIWFGYTNPTLIPPKIRNTITNAPSNLTFAGYVDNQEIIQAMQGCDLYLCMTYEETEGIPAIEACASKTNFIVRDIPVFDGWLIDQKNVYKAKSLDDFQSLIESFQLNKLPSLTEAAYSVAQERDLFEIGKQLKSIYEWALISHPKQLINWRA